MNPSTRASACDWPDCDELAAHELPIEAVAFNGTAFAVCEGHAPRIARIALDAADDALRHHAARTNFAPGDAEWTDALGDDRQ